MLHRHELIHHSQIHSIRESIHQQFHIRTRLEKNTHNPHYQIALIRDHTPLRPLLDEAENLPRLPQLQPRTLREDRRIIINLGSQVGVYLASDLSAASPTTPSASRLLKGAWKSSKSGAAIFPTSARSEDANGPSHSS
jgi:hypothetical protein